MTLTFKIAVLPGDGIGKEVMPEGALAAEAAPFGGIKESGYGREGSRYGLENYMHTKYMCLGGIV